MHSHSILNLRIVAFPYLQSNSSIFIILLPEEMPHQLSSVVTESGLLFPYLECTFLLLFHASSQNIPRFVDRTGLVLVSRHLVIEILPPCIENAGLNLVTFDHVRDVHILVTEGQWFQCIHIPLMEGRLLPIHSNFITDHAEGFQFIVTILIEI